MLGLITSTVLTSAADSLNPISISQQFVLQGLVKKSWHIWFFIISIAITNFTGGMLAYFGLLTPIANFFSHIMERYHSLFFAGELGLGVAFLAGVVYVLVRRSKGRLVQNKEAAGEEGKNSEAVSKKIISVSPMALTLMGIVATLSELTTALPYFAFLAILFTYELSLGTVTAVMVLYNIIYSLPLIFMYFIYVKAQDRFDKLYGFVKEKMARGAAVAGPLLAGIIGSFFVIHGGLHLWG